MFVVRSNLYHLLGIFATVFPEYMVKYSNKLLEVYVGSLKAEVTLLTQCVTTNYLNCNIYCLLSWFLTVELLLLWLVSQKIDYHLLLQVKPLL